MFKSIHLSKLLTQLLFYTNSYSSIIKAYLTYARMILEYS